MRLFISWSGERSKMLASALHDWLPLVLHYVDPWLSEADISAGERWAQSVATELGLTNFGIVCVTSENVNAPWMLFEAGALTKSLDASRVIPVLLDLEFSDISGPLAQFQAKKLTRGGMDEIVTSLQSSSEESIPPDRARQLFDALWPELEKRLTAIPKQAPDKRYVRPQSEVLEELVSNVRTLDARLRTSEETTLDLSRGVPKVNRGHRLSPGIMRDIIGSLPNGSHNSLGILIFGSLFREDLPWITELSLDAYRARGARRSDAGRALRRLAKTLDTPRSALVELSVDPDWADAMLYEFRTYLEYFIQMAESGQSREQLELDE